MASTLLLGLSVAALALGGCANNAVLEVHLSLPAQPDAGFVDAGTGVDGGAAPTYAFVQIRAADGHPFDVEWTGDDYAGTKLTDQMPGSVDYSAISTDGTIDARMKVRFCRTPSCSALADSNSQEDWYELQHPFYIGQRTSWDGGAPYPPPLDEAGTPEVDMVDKCQIRAASSG